MKKGVMIFSVIASLFFLPLVSADADFAIYTGPGSWEPSILAFQNFLDWKGLTWEEVNHRDINRGELIGHYDALFMPGGWAGTYNQRIRASGDQHIREFIAGGGSYIGMSAGAFYACDVTIWEGDYLEYPSDIFDGDCIGPIPEIAPWPEYTMTTMDINLAFEANQYEPAQRDVLYYGEPYFVAHPGQDFETFASWIVPSNPVADGKPGIIGFDYGAGRVVLVGPHPEIEEDDDRDGNDFGEELSDGPDGSDWPFLWTAVDWMMHDPISMPPGYEAPALIPTDDTACSDGVDNDGDGLIDLADPGCESAQDDDEYNEVVEEPTGPATLFYDDFEDGIGLWFTTYDSGANPWTTSSSDPAFGERSAFCRPQDTTDPASTITTVVDTTGHDEVTISYYRKVNGLDAADDFIASWSDGSAWHELEHVSSHTDSSYVFRSYTLPGNEPNFGIRFSCTAGAVSEWCSVDDVLVEGN